ncbi:hypothetical protein VNO78_02541 [Psophocarpus tetragonolobus]|uniref:RING-type E3 ubiquitin transferase n=1 Tax=Psophocarpus tetragonolobus TaxID=3891 RepID=A0AAN9SZ21_PSOTE
MSPKQLSDPSEKRRPLSSFPVVQPCITVSSSVLVSSLVARAQNICNFDTRSFVLQRRNLREMVRQIAILLIFFQEIHERGSVLALPVRLCFSDIHVIFQKINFLMQDCSLESARVWVLLKSEFIVTQFHVLMRSLATVLELLPLCFVDISDEVKELVELVTKQAQRGKVELDENDEREMKRLRFILDQLERGVEPDGETVKLVLDYVGVRSWSACNKEIKFLEDELDFNDKEGGLLNSLIGLLCYSRVVVFETMEIQAIAREEQGETKCNTETLTCVVPEDFLCPISLEIMTDPVTVSTGQTYNRASIQKWLKSGNMVCPKTREKLTSTELFPNAALKKLIKQFCSENGIGFNQNQTNHTVVKFTEAGSPGAAHAMQFSAWFLSRKLVFGTEEQKNKAAYEVRLLARSNVFNRACLVEMGTVAPLLDLLTTDDRVTQENAISALVKLSKHSSGRQVIAESRGLVPILNVLKRGLSLEARHVAAAIIFYLSSEKEYRKLIGENPEAIPALVEMVREGTSKNNAVVAIFGLLLRLQNHAKVLAAGAVPALVNVLSSSDKPDLVMDSLAVLVALVESVEGAYAVFRAEALPLVVRILQSATSRAGKEYCVSILLALCVNVGGVQVTGVLAKDPSLMPSLYSLLTDGTPHATKKARSLINLLLDF